MAKYRRYVRNNTDQFQPHQISLMGVGIILSVQTLLFILLIGLREFDYLNSLFKATLISSISILFLPLILMLFLTLILNTQREIIAPFKLPQMSSDQKNMAKKIKLLFNPKQLIDVLKLSNSTRYGEELPNVEVWVDSDYQSGFIGIENIGNFSYLDKPNLEKSITGILSGSFEKLSIINSHLNKGDKYMLFHFENTVDSKRFLIKNNDLTPFISTNPHHIKLSKDLIWHTDLTPHMSCIARTRSGKSMLMGGYIAELMVIQGWYVEFHSVKVDKYVKKFNGCFLPESIVERCEYWCDEMEKRLKQLSNEGKDTYLQDKSMKIIGLFFDEIGNLNGQLESNRALKKRWESAITRLTATGASCGIHVIAISQKGTVEGFLPSTAKTNCSDAVIMLGSAADSGSERQFLMPGFAEMPIRNYGIGEGLARFNSSGDKWMSPQYFEAPWLVDD